jgi:hypothetical protein
MHVNTACHKIYTILLHLFFKSTKFQNLTVGDLLKSSQEKIKYDIPLQHTDKIIFSGGVMEFYRYDFG